MMERALLNALRSSRDNTGRDNTGDDIFVSSLRDAHALLQLHKDPSGARFRRRLVEYITNPEHSVLSECDEYHNFVMDLFRLGDHNLALQVCDYALVRAPYNRDMLGDAIKACGDSSQFDLGEIYLARATEIPYCLWTYRLFLYSVDFLKTKLSAYPMDTELYERALRLAREYISQHPYDEHGYNQEAELMVMMNDRDSAVTTLRRYILDTNPDPDDRRLKLVAAQCCITLLNLLDGSSNYEFIIQICNKGLQYTTKEQPSASMGFFVYRKALAMDALFLSLEHRPENMLRDVLKTYQSAYDLVQDRPYGRTVEERYAILGAHLQNPEDFQPLVRRNLYINKNSDISFEL